ncbi:MAG: hypothetical protein LUC18_04685 [Porphyromonadaceae bacterium]|nr:hypothetical protein [Porphyromonadaceae bacterium]
MFGLDDAAAATIIASVIGTAGSAANVAATSSLNKKNRDWQAEQAQIAREYQTQERLDTQEWQEQFYNEYSSPAATVRQYEEAGLNPALMYENASSATGDVPSGSAGSGIQAEMPAQNLGALDVIGNAVESFLKIEQGMNQLQQSREAGYRADRYNEITDATLSSIKANIDYLGIKGDTERTLQDLNKEQLAKLDSEIGEINARIANIDEDTVLKRFQRDNVRQSLKNMQKQWKLMDWQDKQQAVLSLYNWFAADSHAMNLCSELVSLSKCKVNISEVDLNIALKKRNLSEAYWVDFQNRFAAATGFPIGSAPKNAAASMIGLLAAGIISPETYSALQKPSDYLNE